MTPVYYAIFFDEPACPAYCSGSRLYFGTLEEISQVMNRLRLDKHFAGTVSSWEAYLAGENDAEHVVAYAKETLLQPVQYISSANLSVVEKKWEHANVWGCLYQMHFNKAEVREVIILFNGIYYRCIRAWIENLSYESIDSSCLPLIDHFWGNAFLLNVEQKEGGNFIISNLLYEIEEHTDDLKNITNRIGDPNTINFSPICDEIFADG